MPPKVLFATPPHHLLALHSFCCGRWWWWWRWPRRQLQVVIRHAPVRRRFAVRPLQASNQSRKQNTFSHEEGQERKSFMHRRIHAKQLSSTWGPSLSTAVAASSSTPARAAASSAPAVSAAPAPPASQIAGCTSRSITLMLTWMDSTSIYTR